MFTDPILQHACASRLHADLIHQGDRERFAGQACHWHRPVIVSLTLVRASLGGAVVHLGQIVQGAAAIPAPARKTT